MSAIWHYQCARCGFTSVSSNPHLTRCSARSADVNGPVGAPCGGEFREEDPYAYHWELVNAGLIEDEATP